MFQFAKIGGLVRRTGWRRIGLCRFGTPALMGCKPRAGKPKWAPHLHGAIKEGQVLAHLFVNQADARIGPKGSLELVAELFLLPGKSIERHFKIGGQKTLYPVAIEPDQLSKKLNGQKVLAPAFFVKNDLGKNRTGDVLIGARIKDNKINALAYHFGQGVKGDIGA